MLLYVDLFWSIGWEMGLSENRVYFQWNSHLIGIMISKTIGFRGTQHFQTHPNWFQTTHLKHRPRHSSAASCTKSRRSHNSHGPMASPVLPSKFQVPMGPFQGHFPPLKFTLWWTNIAMENDHRNSGFSHEKRWFSGSMFIYQRVCLISKLYSLVSFGT